MSRPTRSILQLIESKAEGDKLYEKLFWKLMPVPFSGCFIWTGANDGVGDLPYGKFKHKGVTLYVHRAMWELKHGPLQDHLVLDHVKSICSCRSCCNDKHLEPVTYRENTERGNGSWIFYQRAAEEKGIKNATSRIYTPSTVEPCFGDNEF